MYSLLTQNGCRADVKKQLEDVEQTLLKMKIAKIILRLNATLVINN